MREQARARLRLVGSALLRTAGLLALWLALARGDAGALTFGLPVALIATGLSLHVIRPGPGFSATRLSSFVGSFIARSLVASVDVAGRATAPLPDVSPGMFTYELSLESPGARAIVADLVSLLPGTLSADLQGRTLTIHALDQHQDNAGEIRRLEAEIRAVLSRGIA